MTFSPTDAVEYGFDTFKRRPWFFIGAMLVLFVLSMVVNLVANIIGTGLTVAVPYLSVALMNSLGMQNPSIVATGLWLVLALLSNGLQLAVTVLILMCTTGFLLAAADQPDRAGLSDLWHRRPFWSFLGAYILFVLLLLVFTIGPYLALTNTILEPTNPLSFVAFFWALVAFVFCLVVFFPWAFVVMDRKLGPIQSLKESWALTRGNRWKILGLFALFFLIQIVGSAAVLVAFYVGQAVFGNLGATVLTVIVALGVLLVLSPAFGIASAHAYSRLAGGTAKAELTDPEVFS